MIRVGPERVAVLGAGLQGACLALELAARGLRVEVYDRAARPLDRASLRNEGKVHLGLVYAHDTSRRTAATMLHGALCFEPLLSRWTAGGMATVARSRPFDYLVAHDSQLPPSTLRSHYAWIERACRPAWRIPEASYLGGRPERLWRPLAAQELARWRAPERLQAGFATEELSVSTDQVAQLLRRVLSAHPGVELRLGHEVHAVRRHAQGLEVEATDPQGQRRGRTHAQVVNALWTDRLAIDATLDLRPARSWVHRLKHRVLVELPASMRGLPSCTLVFGAYGDLVVHPDEPAYVSYYPECMTGWSEELAPPAAWGAACAGRLDERTQRQLGQRALAEFDRWLPGLAQARIVHVDAGVIFAWGSTDITDDGSGLHRRSAIGVSSHDGYHSIDTGKYTTAPLFALQAADAITGPRREHAAQALPDALREILEAELQRPNA